MQLKCKACGDVFDVAKLMHAADIECPSCGNSLRHPNGVRIMATPAIVPPPNETAQRKRSSREQRPSSSLDLSQLGPDALTYSPSLPLSLVATLELARVHQWPLRLHYSRPIAYGDVQMHEGYVYSPKSTEDRCPCRAQVPHAEEYVDMLCEELLVKVERLDNGTTLWAGQVAEEAESPTPGSGTGEATGLIAAILVAIIMIGGAICGLWAVIGWLRGML